MQGWFQIVFIFQFLLQQRSISALNTTVSFVDRAASLEEAAKNDTQVELAKLYAHISAMPESAKKRKLMKQINKANMATSTPCASPKHKRSKSLSDSIKVS